MPASTARIVLEKRTLRWSSPLAFNDPFDHQVSFVFPFSPEDFEKELVSSIEASVYGDEPVVVERTNLAILIQMLRGIREKAPRAEVMATLREGAKESAAGIPLYMQRMNSLIYGLHKSRVLCVAESNENVVMWSHYADSHRGVCFKLNCARVHDHVLQGAKEVRYSREFPIFPTVQSHIRHLTGEAPIEYAKLVYEIPFIKHEDWSYEREWRVHLPHDPVPPDPPGVSHNDWPEPLALFEAMYIGCRSLPEDTEQLIAHARKFMPGLNIYIAKSSRAGFSLEFELVP